MNIVSEFFVYGKKGNRWTDLVVARLEDLHIKYVLIQDFVWSRDPITMSKSSPFVYKNGDVAIPRMPTIRFFDEIEVWVDGYEACMEFFDFYEFQLFLL